MQPVLQTSTARRAWRGGCQHQPAVMKTVQRCAALRRALLTSHIVLLPSQHNLRRAVVPRRDIPRHLRVLNPCQSKVADLQIAVLVDKDVRRLEIAVHYAGRVDVLETAEDLVEEVLDELLLERA